MHQVWTMLYVVLDTNDNSIVDIHLCHPELWATKVDWKTCKLESLVVFIIKWKKLSLDLYLEIYFDVIYNHFVVTFIRNKKWNNEKNDFRLSLITNQCQISENIWIGS